METDSIPQHVRVILERLAKENGFQNPRYEVTAGSEQGDNFVGQVKRVTLSEAHNSSKAKLDLIIKSAPQNAKRRELYRTKHFFKNEACMYDVILPALTRLLKTKGIVSKNQVAFPGTARAYATHLSKDGDEDTVIMEDMGAHGFEMGDRFAGADPEQCRAVIRQLARLHAASIMLKEEDPEEHNRLVGSLEETMCVSDWESSYEKFADRARTMIDSRFPEGTKERSKFELFAGNFFQTMSSIVEPKEQFSVICHGDLWVNNVLFKYDKGSTIPTDTCLIDLQLARYTTPITDLSYFFFCSTTKAVRDQRLNALLKDYHRFLCSFLKTFGCPNDKIVTWETLEDQCRKYMKFGLGMAIITIPVFMSRKGDMQGVEDSADEAKTLDETLIDTGGENPARDERLSDVLQDMVDLGYV